MTRWQNVALRSGPLPVIAKRGGEDDITSSVRTWQSRRPAVISNFAQSYDSWLVPFRLRWPDPSTRVRTFSMRKGPSFIRRQCDTLTARVESKTFRGANELRRGFDSDNTLGFTQFAD